MIRLLLPVLLFGAAPAAPAADMRPADPVLRTLLEGEAARASGNHAALLDTVQALRALGATPAEGQEDLAARWTSEAQAHGAVASALTFRGRALGPAYRHGSLVPGGSMTMRQLFLGGHRAQISVAPATGNATNLSVRVHGADGETLCAKPVGEGQVDCAWLPIFTDRYDIIIENGGKAAVGFYLIMR